MISAFSVFNNLPFFTQETLRLRPCVQRTRACPPAPHADGLQRRRARPAAPGSLQAAAAEPNSVHFLAVINMIYRGIFISNDWKL